MTLYPNNTTPRISCEIDFLRKIGEHTEDQGIQCNAQVLFLSRAAVELESIIDRKIEETLSRQDRADIALLELQAMSYRVRSKMVSESCKPKDVTTELQTLFELPTQIA